MDSGDGCSMDMTFHFSDDFCLFIEQWHVKDAMVYAITCLAVILLAFGREYLAVWREVRHRSKKKRRKRGINVQAQDDENVTVPLIDSSITSSTSPASSTSSTPHSRLRLQLGGMTCNACVNTIQQALKAENGVLSAVVSLEREMADIVYMPDQIAPSQLISQSKQLDMMLKK
jgi:copper chaperone CopZ